MKRTILALLIALFSISFVQARTFVLSAGVSNYGGRANNLRNPSNDAKAFKELMSLQTKDITLLTSKYATGDNILEKLRAICNRAQKGDRVVFFFSGHGSDDGTFCAYDRNVSYSEVVNVLDRSQASEIICYFDACFAGKVQNARSDKATEPEWSKAVKSKDNTIFFVSSRPNEVSRDGLAFRAGYFTQALLKGLRGKADADADKSITVLELFRYIYGDVSKRAERNVRPDGTREQQHPQLIGPKSMHNVVLAKWK